MRKHFDAYVDSALDAMSPAKKRRVQGYFVALLLVLLALAVRLLIAPVEAGIPFLTFFPAVTLAAVFGGMGPGILALLVSSGIATYMFIPPFGELPLTFHKEAVWANLIFAAEELLVIVAVVAMYQQRGKFIESSNLVEQLHQTKQELQISAAAFQAQEGIMITDSQSKILRVNQAFSEITGYAAEEIVGLTPKILQSGRHNETFYAEMWKQILSEGTWSGEIWDRRKNGEVYPKWLTITAIKDQDGVTTHYVSSQSDITERKASEEMIHHLAFYDSLTRLPNRRLLMERLNQALSSSVRNGRNGALLFIDLDNFKTLNDLMGHNIGDMLLMQVAERVSSAVRDCDTVARMGGDEFVVMLLDLHENMTEAATQAKQIGKKILDNINGEYSLNGHAHNCGASIGIALFNENTRSSNELIKQADIAMYQAKKSGRNSVRFFDPEMQETIKQRASLEKELIEAIAHDQLYLCYQALVSTEGEVAGVEALVRWRHPERGVVPPDEFIPLAEETNLILPLGNWVLRTACAQLASWATRPEMQHLTIAVNVSAREFKQDEFASHVTEILEQTGAPPERLKLELTESMLVADGEITIAKMSAIKALGVGFSLDDFGTGYSSLSYLSRMPVDILKIDRSFVSLIETDDSAVVICAATINLAHQLNMKVVAEGVENYAQSYFLSGVHKSDYLQGYLFSKPLEIEAFEAFMKSKPARIKL